MSIMIYYYECHKCRNKYEATIEDVANDMGEAEASAPLPKEIKMVAIKPNNYVFECVIECQ